MSRTATTACPRSAVAARTSLLGSGACRWTGHAVVALALLWLAWLNAPALAISTALLSLSGAVLVHRPPAGLERRVIDPVRGLVWRRRLRRCWNEVATACELTRENPPEVRSTWSDWPRAGIVVRPCWGQTYLDYEKAAEALRLAVGAAEIRIEPHGVRDIAITFTLGDALRDAFDAEIRQQGSTALDQVKVGRRADGEDWWLPIGPHTLVAGTSGSGKGSVFWSFAFALAPAVHEGRVQLHGIDLKGGMEVLMGRDLFTSRATSPAEAVVAMERLVAEMKARTLAYAGRVRSHTPSVDEPLHVVMIDELAALTAYCPVRELQRRAEQALNLLCSQGRAPGFVVFACLQDPRKEVIPSRGLFTQMIGLRLKDLSETTMVLGEVAVLSGAHCHRITRGAPGTGYVIPEDGGHPIRVRAGFASDEAIRAVAERFATPTVVTVDAAELEDGIAARQVRRTRSIGGSA